MKNIKVYLLIIITALTEISCSEYLDVRPENQILLEEMWQKESDVEAVLLACYRAMQETDDYGDKKYTIGYMNRVMVWGELRSDNIISGGAAEDVIKQIDNVNILATNSVCSWAPFYKVINYCNTVLEYAPGVMDKDPNFTLSDMQAKEAEALAIRALSYFYLVRTFRDIPWIEKATVADDQTLDVEQSSPEVILENITNDLIQAEQWALTEYPTTEETKGRMTKDAIRAILADVYLWQQDYAQCIDYCDMLINATSTSYGDGIIVVDEAGNPIEHPKYELIEEDAAYELFYQGNASESILELQFSTVKGNDALSDFYGGSGSTGQMVATTSYAEGETVFSSTDERKANSIVVNKTSGGEYQIFKYLGSHVGVGSSNVYSFRTTNPNWIFYRITDIMLMKAEALVQLNRSEEDLKDALHIVNTTYMRSNPTLLETDSLSFDDYSSAAAMEKLVLLERQRELMFEGKRWFDLVRLSERKNSTEDLVGYVLNKYNSNISTVSTKLSVMNALYLPISADELKVNPLLKQNPYYETSSNIEKN